MKKINGVLRGSLVTIILQLTLYFQNHLPSSYWFCFYLFLDQQSSLTAWPLSLVSGYWSVVTCNEFDISLTDRQNDIDGKIKEERNVVQPCLSNAKLSLFKRDLEMSRFYWFRYAF